MLDILLWYRVHSSITVPLRVLDVLFLAAVRFFTVPQVLHIYKYNTIHLVKLITDIKLSKSCNVTCKIKSIKCKLHEHSDTVNIVKTNTPYNVDPGLR